MLASFDCRLQPSPLRKHSNLHLCPNAFWELLLYPPNQINFDGYVLDLGQQRSRWTEEGTREKNERWGFHNFRMLVYIGAPVKVFTDKNLVEEAEEAKKKHDKISPQSTPVILLLRLLHAKTMTGTGKLDFQARRSPVLGTHAAVSTSQPLVRRVAIFCSPCVSCFVAIFCSPGIIPCRAFLLSFSPRSFV